MPSLEDFRKVLEKQRIFKDTLMTSEMSSLIETLHKVNSLNLKISEITGLSNKFSTWEKLNLSNAIALSDTCQRLASISNVFNNFINPKNIYSYKEYDFLPLYTNPESAEKKYNESAKTVIIEESSRIKSVISTIYHNNGKLYSISSREFEEVIKELLYHQGFEAQLTKQTRDGGFDIIAMKYVANLSPIKYLVECKRYGPNRRVGVEVVRSFKEVLSSEGAHKGIIATTSYFSKDAINKRNFTPLLLDFVDKDEVLRWVKDYLKI